MRHSIIHNKWYHFVGALNFELRVLGHRGMKYLLNETTSSSMECRRGDSGIARKLQQYPEACEQYPRI